MRLWAQMRNENVNIEERINSRRESAEAAKAVKAEKKTKTNTIRLPMAVTRAGRIVKAKKPAKRKKFIDVILKWDTESKRLFHDHLSHKLCPASVAKLRKSILGVCKKRLSAIPCG
jgi:hypothetical protein